MARIALVDASAATAALVEAAAGGAGIVRCGVADVPAGTGLVVADVARSDDLARALESLAGSEAPVLLLVGRRVSVDRSAIESGRFTFLKNPCDLIDLQREIRALLEVKAAASGSVAPSDWLSPPRIPADAAATLAAARRLSGPVWIVGEPGTGADQAAAALALAWDNGREPAVWQDSDSPSSALARLEDDRRVLWVPALDGRPIREQHAFEQLLAIDPLRRIVVTSSDNPGDAVAGGSLAPALYSALSRIAVRLPPLRERTGDIVALALLFAERTASALGAARCDLSSDARRLLETYPWPGNLVELEAVVTRSVLARAGQPEFEIDAGHLLFAATLDADIGNAAATQIEPAASGRRAVVLPIAAGVSSRANRSSDSASTEPTQPSDTPSLPRSHSSGVEAVLAGFAHDLRNPMATIKTFAALQADGGELAQLAASACEAIDSHLNLLQRYAQLRSGGDDDARADDTATIDLVDILGEAVETVGAESALEVAARGSLRVHCDVALARFIADSIVAECQTRGTEGAAATADLTASRSGIAVRIPVGSSAIEQLGKWLGDGQMPWRLAIARDAARRTGGDLEVQSNDAELCIEWRIGSVAEQSESAPLRTAVSSSSSSSSPARTSPSGAASRPKAKQQ